MDIPRPPRGWVQVEQAGDELELRWRAKGFAAAFWIAVFVLTPALCAFWIVKAACAPAPTLGDSMCSIFWIAMALSTAGYPLRSFLGTERLRIGPDGLDFQARALIPLQERHVPLGEIKGIDDRLRIETLGKPVRFWQYIEPGERRWLADLLQRHLQALIPDRVIMLQSTPGTAAKPTVPIEVPGPFGATPEPPSDCAIRMHTDWDRVEFVRSRAFSLDSYGFNSLYTILGRGFNSLYFTLALLLPFLTALDLKAPWFLLLFLSLCWAPRRLGLWCLADSPLLG
jgi:hypothetical protein